MPEEPAFDDIGDSEVGKPYRGKMVVHISVEITKISEEKGRVKRFTTLEDGFIVIEDTVHWIDHIELEWGKLPHLEIGVPFTDPSLAKGNKDNIKEKDPNSADQQELRKKAREKLKERGIQVAEPKEEKKKPDTMQIFVKKMDGTRVPLKVSPSNTVEEIKKMVEDKAGVPVDDQHMDYEGTELENDSKTLEEYKVKKGHTIDLIPRPMKIKVKKIDGGIINVCVSPAKSIEDIKKKVEEMEGIPVASQNMEFGDKPLENSPSLLDYDIKDGDIIELVPDPITVKVKTIGGETITLPNINPLKTSVADVKKMVEEKKGIPVDEQNMEFDDKFLEDSPSLIDYEIKDGDTICLVPDPITIKVKTIGGETISIPNINPLKTSVADVKKMIQEKNGIPVDEQNLELNDNPLEDGPSLLDSNIKDGDTLCLQPDPIKVNVRCPDGKTITITDINPLKTSVADFKKLVEDKEGIPVADQNMEFGEKPLEDGPSLLDYNIKDGDTVDLVVPITVKKIDGSTVPLLVSPLKSIEDIKKMIQEKEGIPIEDQNMQHDGKNLKNPTTLLDNKIKAGDTIELVPEPNPISINFKKPDGTTVTLTDVPPLKPIEHVKKMLMEQEGIPINEQHLEYKGKKLDDEPTVQDYEIKDGDTIDIVPMEIIVKHWTGAKFHLRVEPNFTLDQVKDIIQKKPPKIKKEEQVLKFKDDTLDDDGKTLTDYGIKHGDMIQTVKMKSSQEKKESEKKSYLSPEWKEKQKQLYGEVKNTYYKTDYCGDNDEGFLKGKTRESVQSFEFGKQTVKTKVNADGTEETERTLEK